MERYYIDHKGASGAFDMHEIVENIFMSATKFMEDSGLCMDEDRIGKQQDLYLRCSLGGAKTLGLCGCP